MKRFFAILLVSVMLALSLVACDQALPVGIIDSEIIDGELWITYSNSPDVPVSLGRFQRSETDQGRLIVDVDIADGYLWVTYSDAPDAPVKIGKVADSLRLPLESEAETKATGGTQKVENTDKSEVLTEIYTQYPPTYMGWDSFDFEGETLTVLVRNDQRVTREWEKEIIDDDELDLAVANRNDVVEGNLNLCVNIIYLNGSDVDSWRTAFIQRVQSDVDNYLHDIDIAAGYGFHGFHPALRDYYHNVHDKDTFPYFDLDFMCWNQTLVKNGTLNGRLYSLVGDINLSMFDAANVIWHNKDMYDRIKTDDDVADIQDLAIVGDWTWLELYKWASYSNNSQDGACSHEYGACIPNTAEAVVSVPAAFDFDLIRTASNGSHSYSIGTEDVFQALSKWKNLVDRCENSMNSVSEECDCVFGIRSHFTNGKVLFMADVLNASEEINDAIRTMEDNYSILPWPKADEGQAQYYTMSQDYMNVMHILDHSRSSVPTKGEAVSAYLQYAAEYTYTHVRGYYFERIVKPKFYGTDDSSGLVTKSVSLFVTIIDGIRFDFATIYSSSLCDFVENVWCEAAITGKTLEEKFNGNKDEYVGMLERFDKWFGIS